MLRGPSAMQRSALLRALARTLAAGAVDASEFVERAKPVLGKPWPSLQATARRYVERFGERTRPRKREIIEFLLKDASFRRALNRHTASGTSATLLAESQQMWPSPAAQSWAVPPIETANALAQWLRLSLGELEWFADLKAIASAKSDSRLSHYRYRVLAKDSGSIRLIEAPKQRLRQIQRKILAEILNRIPAHPAVHGFVCGRSIKTFAAPHVARPVVLRMDIRDFFPSIIGARVQALFRTAGYPETIADLLGGLCTNSAPRAVWKDALLQKSSSGALHEIRDLYRRPHLPQGAPTSPALANLCFYRADSRLSGLAQAVGATYTRYADDLAFSGDHAFEQRVERFSKHVAAILLEEGFAVNHRKTRIMRQGVRQYLAGTVVNQRVNIVRTDFDELKAILTNCVRFGQVNQNRAAHSDFRAHLNGRVGFVESINPHRGAKLRRIFERIEW